MSAVVVAIFVTVAALAPSVASAAVTCEPGHKGFVENESGEGAWCSGAVKPVSEFTKEETASIKRRTLGVALAGGYSGNTAGEVAGASVYDTAAVGEILTQFRTEGTKIGTPTANAFNDWMESMGSIPPESEMLPPIVALGPLAFYTGWKIGGVVRGWLGLEGVEGDPPAHEGSTSCEAGCLEKVTPGTVHKLCEGGFRCQNAFGANTETKFTVPEGYIAVWSHEPVFAYNESAWAVLKQAEGSNEMTVEKGTKVYYPGYHPETFGHRLVPEPQEKTWEEWICKPGEPPKEACGGEEGRLRESRGIGIVGGFGVPGGLSTPTFPGATEHTPSPEKGSGVNIPAPPKVSPVPAVPKFDPKTAPNIPNVPPPLEPEIVRPVIVIPTGPDATPGTKPLPSKTEEEAELEIPKPAPLEVGTVYKTRLETAGFTKVTLATLPETAIDTSIGPEQVSYTVPSEGSRVAPATIVTVEQNPADAPMPSEPPAGAGAPTLPGFHVPKFGVACELFPFGVPCWLVKEIGKWSSASKAPEVNWPMEFLGPKKTITIAFNFNRLEPVMEYVRPALIVISTISVVLMFFRFAIGGGGGGPVEEGSGD